MTDFEALVLEHLFIPAVITAEWRRRLSCADHEEMHATLNLALIMAAAAYDPSKGEFRTYAWLKVRCAAKEHLRSLDHTSRKVRRAIRDGDLPQSAEMPRPLSADALYEVGWEPIVDDDFTEAVDTQVDTRARLAAALAALTPRQRDVIINRYWHESLGKDVAARLGVDESRISQIHREALNQLRAHMRATE